MRYIDKIGRRKNFIAPYFKDEDINWCSVPVPSERSHIGGSGYDIDVSVIAKYGQSQTHPSIGYIEEGFGGHKYWMATTPYPHANPIYENACIYYGDEDENGNPPSVFYPISGGVANSTYPMVNNPIIKLERNEPAINSDAELWYDKNRGKLCLITRTNEFRHAYLYQESDNGLRWTKRKAPVNAALQDYLYASPSSINNDLKNYILCDDDADGVKGELVSPSVILNDDGSVELFGLRGNRGGSYEDNSLFGGMWVYNGNPSGGYGSMKKSIHASLLGYLHITPWHMDIEKHNNKYYMVFCGSDLQALNYHSNDAAIRDNLYLAVSNDGFDFRVFPTPLLNIGGQYRPSLMFKGGDIVIYGSCYNSPKTASSYPNGDSDVPVDGRAIYWVRANINSLVSYLDVNNKLY